MIAALVATVALAAAYPPPSSQGLVPARGYSWLCDGASARAICHQHVPARLRRPIRIGTVTPGYRCPGSPTRPVARYGVGLGRGPAYPIPFPKGILRIAGGRIEGGWIYAKVLWAIAPSYRGPLLIRGRRVDGTDWLGFDRGPHPLRELQIPPLAPGVTRGWRDFPSYTRFRGPGCYAYQVDGTTFSKILVFAAG